MANALYDLGRQGFLDGSIDWDTDTIKAVLVDTGTYTVNLATHEFLSDVSGSVATSSALSSKTVTNGVADAADVALTAVTTGHTCAVVLYKDTGVAGTSRLIAYIDTGTNFPIVTNGGDVTIAWDNGSNKIFKL